MLDVAKKNICLVVRKEKKRKLEDQLKESPKKHKFFSK
jgi:hypothetical protein